MVQFIVQRIATIFTCFVTRSVTGIEEHSRLEHNQGLNQPKLIRFWWHTAAVI
jgi:hypothetical protein